MVALGLWERPGPYIFWRRTGRRKTTTKRIEICVVVRRRLHYDAASIRSACRPAQLHTDKQHGVAWLLLCAAVQLTITPAAVVAAAADSVTSPMTSRARA